MIGIEWEKLEKDDAERLVNEIEYLLQEEEHDAEWAWNVECETKIAVDGLVEYDDGTYFCPESVIKELEIWLASEYEVGVDYVETYDEERAAYYDYVDMIAHRSWYW